MERLSQEWADHLIEIGTIKHDYSSMYGENIFAGWNVFLKDDVTIKKSLVGWLVYFVYLLDQYLHFS